MPHLCALSEANVNYHSSILSDSQESACKKSVKYNEEGSIHINTYF